MNNIFHMHWSELLFPWEISLYCTEGCIKPIHEEQYIKWDSLRASSPFGKSREVTWEQHAKGDTSVSGILSRILSQLTLLAINGKLASRHQVRWQHLPIVLDIADYLNLFGLFSQLKIFHQLSLDSWGSKKQQHIILKVKIMNAMIKAVFSRIKKLSWT